MKKKTLYFLLTVLFLSLSVFSQKKEGTLTKFCSKQVVVHNKKVADSHQNKINNKEALILQAICKAYSIKDTTLATQILADNIHLITAANQKILLPMLVSKQTQKDKITSGVYDVLRTIVIENKEPKLVSYAASVLGSIDLNLEKFDAKNLESKFDQIKIEPVFHPKSSSFYFSYKKAGKKEDFYTFDIHTGTKPLYNKKEIDSILFSIQLDTSNVYVSPTFIGNTVGLDVFANNKQYQYLPTTKQLLTKEENTPKDTYWGRSPNHTYEVFFKDFNLFIRNLANATEVPLTFDINKNTTYLMPTIKWMGSSNRFIIQKINDEEIRDMSVINSTFKVPYVYSYKYAIPGDTRLKKHELLIGDAEHQWLKTINVTKWEGQEISIIHSDNPNLLYFTRLKRTHDHIELCSVDADGVVNVLISETYHPNFNDMMFHCEIINKGNDILFWSDRTGWGHYYHYNKNGELLNPLTEGSWTSGKIINIDEKQQTIYFMGYGKEEGINPNYSLLYKVNLDGSNTTLLTPENANHTSYVHTKGDLIIDNYSRIDTIPVIVARNCNGKFLDTILKPNIKPLLAYGWRFPEQFKVKAADHKTDLYGIMWKPDNFDPNKKYPIISQVYPGPFTETVWTDFTVLDKYQNTALAQRGFIVVCFGHRGSSPIRNKEYASYGFGNLRDYPLADDKYGLEQLAKRFHFIDATKVGILGHSGGALMSVTAMCTYPDFYKVAVASSGNYDNTMYHKNWGEYYQGIGEDLQFSVKTPMELAANLSGKLLLVTGESDQNVHPSHTFKMVNALIKANKVFDMLVLPGQGHHYQGIYDQYFEKRKRDYFSDYFLNNK